MLLRYKILCINHIRGKFYDEAVGRKWTLGSLGTGTFDPRHAELENGSKVPVPNDPRARLLRLLIVKLY